MEAPYPPPPNFVESEQLYSSLCVNEGLSLKRDRKTADLECASLYTPFVQVALYLSLPVGPSASSSGIFACKPRSSNTKPWSVLYLRGVGTSPHAYFFGRYHLTVSKVHSLHTPLLSMPRAL